MMDEERWNIEVGIHNREEQERELDAMKKKTCAPLWAMLKKAPMSQLFGGGESGELTAAMILEVEYDLPYGSLTRRKADGPASDSSKPDQSQSNSIKPDQTRMPTPETVRGDS